MFRNEYNYLLKLLRLFLFVFPVLISTFQYIFMAKFILNKPISIPVSKSSRYPHLPQGLPISPHLHRVHQALRRPGRRRGQEPRPQDCLHQYPQGDQVGQRVVPRGPHQGPLQGRRPGHTGGDARRNDPEDPHAPAVANAPLPGQEEHQEADRAEEGARGRAAQCQGFCELAKLGLVEVVQQHEALVDGGQGG